MSGEPPPVADSAEMLQLTLDSTEVEQTAEPAPAVTQLRDLPGDTWHDIFEDAA